MANGARLQSAPWVLFRRHSRPGRPDSVVVFRPEAVFPTSIAVPNVPMEPEEIPTLPLLRTLFTQTLHLKAEGLFFYLASVCWWVLH